MNLQGKVALVTGSAIRVGKALACSLADQGCHVVVHYGRSSDEANQTVAEIESKGVRAWAISADLGDETDVERLIDQAIDVAGSVDILVNSASVFPEESFESAASATWDHTMMVNLKAPFLLSQSFAARLPVGQQGKIINLLDASSMRPRNHHFSYTISKYGLEGLTKTTAHALASRNIQVNGIALGAILPNSNDPDPAAFAAMADSNPSGRNGDPQAVAGAMLYLLQGADYVTGESICIDGGQHLV
jgi:glucose 1-dehydrogenase